MQDVCLCRGRSIWFQSSLEAQTRSKRGGLTNLFFLFLFVPLFISADFNHEERWEHLPPPNVFTVKESAWRLVGGVKGHKITPTLPAGLPTEQACPAQNQSPFASRSVRRALSNATGQPWFTPISLRQERPGAACSPRQEGRGARA